MSVGNDLIIKQTKNNGKGVFANKDFKKGEILFYCTGKIKDFKDINFNTSEHDYSIQISKQKYLVPMGGFDDFINHSCEPIVGYNVRNKKAFFTALRDIKKSEEIVFDYSTCMAEDFWEMDCNCGSKNCRKRIRDFKYLPKNIQNRYIKLGAVPKFVVDSTK